MQNLAYLFNLPLHWMKAHVDMEDRGERQLFRQSAHLHFRRYNLSVLINLLRPIPHTMASRFNTCRYLKIITDIC